MKKRWLPEHVSEYTDRHGKKRYRYRRKGVARHEFKAAPGSDAFLAELESCKASEALTPRLPKFERGSLDHLIEQFYRSPRWLGMADNSRRTYRGIIERYRERETRAGERFGSLPVQLVTTAHLDRHIAALAATPAAANNLRKTLKRLFGYAQKIGMRADNPAVLTDGFKAGPGWHTWTEAEIAQYRARHALGTRARLAIELLLNTAARRCEVVAIGRDSLVAGRFQVAHAKGNNSASVVALPETLAAIEAMTAIGMKTYLVTEFGKAFTVEGFGNKMRQWCDEADLPQCSAHGLRKACSRRLAEAGSTDAQGMAVTGHKRDRTFAHYRAEANRQSLADDAMANLQIRNLANLEKSE